MHSIMHAGARLGLCMCPGKHSSRSKTHFRRSLTKDVAQLSGAHGVQSLACLLSDAELRVRAHMLILSSTWVQLQTLPALHSFLAHSLADINCTCCYLAPSRGMHPPARAKASNLSRMQLKPAAGDCNHPDAPTSYRNHRC